MVHLSRKNRSTINRFTTGHNGLNCHLFKINLNPHPWCLYCLSIGIHYLETTQHFIFDCPNPTLKIHRESFESSLMPLFEEFGLCFTPSDILYPNVGRWRDKLWIYEALRKFVIFGMPCRLKVPNLCPL